MMGVEVKMLCDPFIWDCDLMGLDGRGIIVEMLVMSVL